LLCISPFARPRKQEILAPHTNPLEIPRNSLTESKTENHKSAASSL
jgi:hypothetical protein